MSLSEAQRKLVIASGLVFLLILTSVGWAQDTALVIDPSTSIDGPTPAPMPKQWRAFPSTGPSDGVLGEFYPTQDVILDSAYPMVNGRRVYLTKTIESGQRSAIFNFTRVYIPAGIRVQVKDYDYVVFNARGDIIVEGTVDARGSNVMFKSGGNILFADGSTVMADGANGIRGEVG